jgi:hypothetical protein
MFDFENKNGIWPGKMQGGGILNYSIEADPNVTTPAPPLGGRH